MANPPRSPPQVQPSARNAWHFKMVASLPGALPGEPHNRWRDPAWSPRGGEIAIIGSDGLYVWNCEQGGEALKLTKGPIWSFAWAPDGSVIAFSPQVPYSSGRRDSIEIVDPRNDSSGRSRKAQT